MIEHHCDLEEFEIKKENYSNRAQLNEDVDLMWLLVWIFFLKIYFMRNEFRIQISELSCLHADVCKMSKLQVHWRESDSRRVNAPPPSPDTRQLCFNHCCNSVCLTDFY